MPSFSIESEGETVPLSGQDIFQTLVKTAGPHATQQSLQVSTKQLQYWERTPGYYSLLQDVYSDFTLDEPIRLQAIIQLKNGIDKHWRKTSTHPIQRDEKSKIKQKAIDVGVQEPKRHLALQNALTLAKIVRFEFPHDWPDMITTLIQHIRNSTLDNASIDYVSNVLNMTLQIIKELASGKLVRTKKSLESVAPELLHVLVQLYLKLVQQWTTSGNEQAMINSHSALKTLRRLVVLGFDHPHRESGVKEVWEITQQHYTLFYSMWDNRQETNLLAKHLFQFSKLWLEMSRQHPSSFVLLGSMEILKKSWDVIGGNDQRNGASSQIDWMVHRDRDADDQDLPMEKLALKALLLFRACVKLAFNPVHTFRYQYPADKEDRKAAVEQMKSQVFSDDFVVQLMEILVIQYFILRQSDLREWEEEPDEWERREEEIADAWEFSIRSCSEKLFLDLIMNFKELLVPRLLQVFQQYSDINNHEVLLKDSLYSAIAIAAACIEDVFDFNSFLKNTLVPEVQLSLSGYNVLRRRIAIVLGRWVPIKAQQLDCVAAYQIFAHLLSPDDKLNDQVVRVTAGRQLGSVFEPFEFSYKSFEPYAVPILSNLMLLIQETELSETKMALLETARLAVTRLENDVAPYAQGIMSILPKLWTESGEEHLMKQAILTMITAIISSLGNKGLSYHESIYPLIHDSIQPASEAMVYLLEEALELWQALLEQTPSEEISPNLIILLRSLIPLLELGSEHLRQCFGIIDSYILLSPSIVLNSEILTPLLRSQKEMLGLFNTTRARDESTSVQALQTLIQTLSIPTYFTPDAKDAALRHLISTMHETEYTQTLLTILHEAHLYHQDPRKLHRPPEVIGKAEALLFTLLSHLTLANPDLFLLAISVIPFENEPETFPWLLTEWLYQYDATPDTLRRKTQLLAITSFLTLTPPPLPILSSLQSLFSIYTDTLTELADGAADENRGDYLFSSAPPGQILPNWPDSDSAGDVRKRGITNWHPVYVVNAREFVSHGLRRAIESVGGQEAFEQLWIAGKVDKDVMSGFVALGIL